MHMYTQKHSRVNMSNVFATREYHKKVHKSSKLFPQENSAKENIFIIKTMWGSARFNVSSPDFEDFLWGTRSYT